jgi:hypothetical protein
MRRISFIRIALVASASEWRVIPQAPSFMRRLATLMAWVSIETHLCLLAVLQRP